MTKAAGIDKSASHSRITVWCAVGSHEVKVASQTLVGLTQRHGCQECREKQYVREHEARHGLPELTFPVTGPDGEAAEVVIPDVTLEEIEFANKLREESMARKSTKADKDIEKRNADEEESFQGALPGMQPAEQVFRGDIENEAIKWGKAKKRNAAAGAAMRDCRDNVSGLMQKYGLREYVLQDGRVVRVTKETFDLIEATTAERKKAEEGEE